MKVAEIIKRLEVDGWYLSRIKGSHGQYKYTVKSGLVTVPGKPSKDLAIGALKSILKTSSTGGRLIRYAIIAGLNGW